MCNCYSYNKGVGNIPETRLTPPKHLGLNKTVCVDACIAEVISQLWEHEIVTINSCCGHNELPPSIILSDSAPKETVKKALEIISNIDSRKFQILSWKLVDCETGEEYK